MGSRRRQLNRFFRCVLLAATLAAPTTLSAEIRFDVTGAIHEAAGARELELRLTNRGDSNARALVVEAELAGQRATAELPGLAAGEARALRLRFASGPARPGRHAVALRIEYRPAQPPDAAPRHEPAFVLVDVGAQAQPALAIRVEPLLLDVAGTAAVVVESADGLPHRAAIRVLLPSGINLLEAPGEVELPAAGRVSVPVRVIRGDAPRGGRTRMLVSAAPLDGTQERASVAGAEIRIVPDPAWLPRLRPFLVALGGLLLLGAIALELRARGAPPPSVA